ncbi:MAG: heavy-metal-associated domain-containing protein [Cytophagales bacterium]
MSRIHFIFLLLLFISACKKLDSEQIFLKNSCEDCKKTVEDYLLSLNGVYYANFDHENEVLVFHFDKDRSKREAEIWLTENGFMQSKDTSYSYYPDCCPKIDTLSKNEEKGNTTP